MPFHTIQAFSPKKRKANHSSGQIQYSKVNLISGMTCASCEEHVNHEVNKLTGIISSNASYGNGNAIIEFDNSKQIFLKSKKAINSTGYSVTDKKKKIKMEIKLQSTITCPNCGHKKEETMPTDACQYFTNVKNANKF